MRLDPLKRKFLADHLGEERVREIEAMSDAEVAAVLGKVYGRKDQRRQQAVRPYVDDLLQGHVVKGG